MLCEICGSVGGVDRHHVIPRRMGGTKDPAVHDDSNLMTLCRQCHRNIHDGRWKLVRSAEGIRVLDAHSGEQVMRRAYDPDLQASELLHLLNVTADCLGRLHSALPYLTDDQLVEAYSYASSFGKRSWMVQAAILHEAQKRSIHGEQSLEAIARRFEIGIRQAQKYALVWKVFFENHGDQENVNIDVFALEEPSWYLVAATETTDPERWLAYAQDRKMEAPRYSVTTFRRDIAIARFNAGVAVAKAGREGEATLPRLDAWACPWVRLVCMHSGKSVHYRECTECEFEAHSVDGAHEEVIEDSHAKL